MITIKDNSLILRTPYNPSFVSDLKAQIPATSRKWDAASKVWIVSTQYLKQVEALLWQYYHYKANIVIPATQNESSVRQFKLEYLGIPKDRGDGTSTAFGWYNEGWNVIFSLEVLLKWFDPSAKPGQSNSLYGLLGVKKTATEQEIKQAYRRTAKQWHPDICKEPDAHEQFIKIQHAYEILSNEQLRKRYNAGLELMAKTGIMADDTGIQFILVSDGQPNSPEDTLRVARSFKSKINTIYIGPEGGSGKYFLEKLASLTGGTFFKSKQVGLLAEPMRLLLGA